MEKPHVASDGWSPTLETKAVWSKSSFYIVSHYIY